MSYNNHDKDDANAVRYTKSTDSFTKEDELNGKAIKIYTMASTMPLKDFMKWYKGWDLNKEEQ